MILPTRSLTAHTSNLRPNPWARDNMGPYLFLRSLVWALPSEAILGYVARRGPKKMIPELRAEGLRLEA